MSDILVVHAIEDGFDEDVTALVYRPGSASV